VIVAEIHVVQAIWSVVCELTKDKNLAQQASICLRQQNNYMLQGRHSYYLKILLPEGRVISSLAPPHIMHCQQTLAC